MLLIYGERQRNKSTAQSLHKNHFPEIRTSSKNPFSYMGPKLKSVSVASGKNQVPSRKTARTIDNVITILDYLKIYPHSSIQYHEQIGLSKSSKQTVLNKFKI